MTHTPVSSTGQALTLALGGRARGYFVRGLAPSYTPACHVCPPLSFGVAQDKSDSLPLSFQDKSSVPSGQRIKDKPPFEYLRVNHKEREEYFTGSQLGVWDDKSFLWMPYRGTG